MNRVRPKILIRAGMVIVMLATLGAAGVTGFESSRARAQMEDAQREFDRLLSRAVDPAPVVERDPTQPRPEFRIGDDANIAATLARIEDIGSEANILFTISRAPKSTVPGRQTYELEGSTTMARLCDLLVRFEHAEDLTLVHSAELRPSSTEDDVLFRLTLACFHEGGRR